MKYHGYIIQKITTDLGLPNRKLNCTYRVYKDFKWKADALTLVSAKEYIDYGEDENYL